VLDTTTFASVAVGLPADNEFQQTLSKYAFVQHYTLPADKAKDAEYEALLEKLSHFKVVMVSIHKMNNTATKSYGISQQTRTFIERLRTKTQVSLVVFGNPYSLKYFDKINHLVCAYEDNEITQSLAAQVLFGAIEVKGKLPVSAGEPYVAGTGFATESLKRLGYSVPEDAGMSSVFLEAGIDSIVNASIKDYVMPGCQVLVAKSGKVVFNKSYGHLSYDSLEPVLPTTMYDIASVTKVAATLQAVMFLHERQLLDVNKKVSFYLPELKGSNKENMLVRDVLMHQAGLIAYLAHWEKTKTRTGLSSTYYSHIQNDLYPLEIAPGMYGMAAMEDSLWKWTIQSRLLYKPKKQAQHRFEYSDLGFYIMQKVAERLLNQPIEDFLSQNFYEPLGLHILTFNPLCKFSESCVAPTEKDKIFRGQLIRGSVHDQGAAMMGGVAGHAGLFSNANDLAILMQMNLQKGYYGGRRYFLEPTIPVFTKSYNKGNRRGLGWDRPRPEGGGQVSDLASRNSFGHSGFTGTFAWVDPDEDLVYIFLSNRVYPTAHNEKLMKYNVRRNVQDVIYKSIINYQTLNHTSISSIKKSD
jgi:CubicO group peptidase (beta-lactamase class C family)